MGSRPTTSTTSFVHIRAVIGAPQALFLYLSFAGPPGFKAAAWSQPPVSSLACSAVPGPIWSDPDLPCLALLGGCLVPVQAHVTRRCTILDKIPLRREWTHGASGTRLGLLYVFGQKIVMQMPEVNILRQSNCAKTLVFR